ncbi:MAG: putative molybdenum carrier protein [Gammaproteobacteria bacterium]
MKIISGGQTGVDRAALDAAIELKIPQGGWCPKGRLAELGTTIPGKYQLKETSSSDFCVRTKLNIKDSDGTLIIVLTTPIKVTDGTLLTIQEVQETNKPYLIIDLSSKQDKRVILDWIKKNNITALNIAGPRESQAPGIYAASFNFLKEVFSELIKSLTDDINRDEQSSSRCSI